MIKTLKNGYYCIECTLESNSGGRILDFTIVKNHQVQMFNLNLVV